MKEKIIFILCCLMTFACHNKVAVNEGNCVKTEEEAIRIAEREWLKIYGKSIYEKLPFYADLVHDSIWTVSGSLPSGWNGGVPYAEINARTCKVIYVIHGK